MLTSSIDSETLFGQNRAYVVPLYQRPYVWKEAQWEPLWEDIRFIVERALRKSHVTPHFLGALVFDQLPTPVGRLDRRLIIDGQQRLVTLQVLLAAMRSISKLWDETDHRYSRALLMLTENQDPLRQEDEDRYKVWPTEFDRDAFFNSMTADSWTSLRKSYKASKLGQRPGLSIYKAYRYFRKVVREWVAEAPEKERDRLNALIGGIRKHIYFVTIDLGSDDDPQVIFETLNARGTPLLPMDLVKNLLIYRADLQGIEEQSIYQQYWKRFDERADFWREKVGHGTQQRPRIDLFLQHYPTMKKRDEVPVTRLYETFRSMLSLDSTSPINYLKEIRQYGDIFEQVTEGLWRGAGAQRLHSFWRRVEAMDVGTVTPVLLVVLNETITSSDEGDEEFDDSLARDIYNLLIVLESFLVRRMVVGLSAKGYSRLFVELLNMMSEVGKAWSMVAVDALRKQSAEGTRWPGDDEFRSAWLSKPIYRVLVRRRVRMLLEALEEGLRTKKTESTHIPSGLTIEHLLPRDWAAHYPIRSEGDMAKAIEKREALIHSLGNLTLLTTALNPAISNGPWAAKRSEIRKHSILLMNNDFETVEGWDESSILERGERLFEVAQRLWPGPRSDWQEVVPSPASNPSGSEPIDSPRGFRR